MNLPELPFSPAAERNKTPLFELLASLLPATARVLEIASGTGQHAAHCAAACPGWWGQPSDVADDALHAIAARCIALPNVARPLLLDVLSHPWPDALAPERFDALLCANLLHISASATCTALMQGAARHLAPSGVLVVYGPFVVDGQATATSNLAFDADLRGRNPAWGLRRLADVTQAAQRIGFDLNGCVTMPANNLGLVFRRIAGSAAINTPIPVPHTPGAPTP